jgi:hypothetical protein
MPCFPLSQKINSLLLSITNNGFPATSIMGMHKSRLFFVISSHKIIGNPVWLYQCLWVWLGSEIQPRPSITHNDHLFPAPPDMAEVRWGPTPRPPTALWEECWWSGLTMKLECKQKVPQNSLGATKICGFTVVLTSLSSPATISPLHHPPEKE